MILGSSRSLFHAGRFFIAGKLQPQRVRERARWHHGQRCLEPPDPSDPEGRWVFYRRELSRGRRKVTLRGWSVEAGDVALADLLGLPAVSTEVHETLRIVEVEAAGDSILVRGLRR